MIQYQGMRFRGGCVKLTLASTVMLCISLYLIKMDTVIYKVTGKANMNKSTSKVTLNGEVKGTEVNKLTEDDEQAYQGGGQVDNHTYSNGTAAKNNKLILLWGKRQEHEGSDRWETMTDGIQAFQRCEWSDCELSRDEKRVPEAAVVFFKYRDPYPEFPNIRFVNQTYVHMLMERPCPELWWLAKFDGKINLTLNYRRDADIPFHFVVKRTDDADQGKYVPRIPFANKTKSVVWAVSHCNAASRRDEYVAELSKYMEVDVYGKCGTLECARRVKDECYADWERRYKFYLSFENSICKDYITEKFYRILQLELIPIVLGGGDYRTAGPPHSYIDVRDYKSPEELAGYLKELAQDEEKYYSYFQWKQVYSFAKTVHPVCILCEIAHNIEKWRRPAHDDYYEWWTNSCQNDLMEQLKREGQW